MDPKIWTTVIYNVLYLQTTLFSILKQDSILFD